MKTLFLFTALCAISTPAFAEEKKPAEVIAREERETFKRWHEAIAPQQITFEEDEALPVKMPKRTAKAALPAKTPELPNSNLDPGTPYAKAIGDGCVAVIYPEIGSGTPFPYEVKDGRLVGLLTARGGDLGVMKITRVIFTNGERKVEGDPEIVRNQTFLNPLAAAPMSCDALAQKLAVATTKVASR